MGSKKVTAKTICKIDSQELARLTCLMKGLPAISSVMIRSDATTLYRLNF
jgi:hypothetical protein